MSETHTPKPDLRNYNRYWSLLSTLFGMGITAILFAVFPKPWAYLVVALAMAYLFAQIWRERHNA